MISERASVLLENNKEEDNYEKRMESGTGTYHDFDGDAHDFSGG